MFKRDISVMVHYCLCIYIHTHTHTYIHTTVLLTVCSAQWR